MRRYEESKLKIESFRFCMENIQSDCFSIVNELIVDAMKLGACDLNFEIMQGTTEFDLPHEVLRSENLVRLSVSGCRIDLEATGGRVGFSKLKSLSLRGVCIVGFSSFDIASNCPLIEDLVLSNCTSIDTVESSNGNSVVQSLGLIFSARIHPYDSLKCLYLKMVQIDELLFCNMSKNFPCLKDLTLNHCRGFSSLRISSPSLEFLSIAYMKHNIIFVELDVPSLSKFTFSGTEFPHLTFEATAREWESYISITHMENSISSHWLYVLKMFLMKLSTSKISLSLCFGVLTVTWFDLEERASTLPEHDQVENLMLCMCVSTSVCSSLLKRVVWTCRPKFITQGWLPQSCVEREENIELRKLLRKTLIQEQSHYMFDKYGPEKVDVEVFEDSLAEWRTLPWKALVDALKSLEKKQKTRFKLRWRQSPSAH